MKTKNKAFSFKSFVAGVVFMAVLSGSVVMANPVMREIAFGVSVRVNGALVEFEPENRPFIMDGRTFLPVRAVADLFGADVDFDTVTNTVLLTGGGAAVATGAPTLLQTTLFEVQTSHGGNVTPTPVVTIMGNAHLDALVWDFTGGESGNSLVTARHNLGGEYARLIGMFDHIDGTDTTAWQSRLRLTIIGDGQELLSQVVEDTTPPVHFDLDVSDVQLLLIQVHNMSGGPNTPALIGHLHR